MKKLKKTSILSVFIFFAILSFIPLINPPATYSQSPSCLCTWEGEDNCRLTYQNTGGCPTDFIPQITSCDDSTETCGCVCASIELNCDDTCNPSNNQCPYECPCGYESGVYRCGGSGSTISQPQEETKIDFQGIMEKAMPTFKFRTATIGDIISSLLRYIFVLAGLGLFVFLIIGGFGLLTSGSDPKKVEASKSQITSAIAGFFIIFVAYWLIQILEIVFGIAIFG